MPMKADGLIWAGEKFLCAGRSRCGRMLDPVETLAVTSHPIGGVCPFGLPAALPIYCDESLKAFAVVYPAAGSRNTSVALSPGRLAALVGAAWIDVCSLPEPTVG